jgi:hypothetical protein
MPHEVRREFETIATARAASERVARDNAVGNVVDRIETAATDEFPLEAVDAESVGVFEFPSGPFDPYRFTVHASVTLTVPDDEDATARDTGETAIESLLERADLDDVTYRGDVTVATR